MNHSDINKGNKSISRLSKRQLNYLRSFLGGYGNGNMRLAERKSTPDRKITMSDIRKGHTGPFFVNCRKSGAKALSGVYQGNGGTFFITSELADESTGWPVFRVWQYRPGNSIRFIGKSTGTDVATVRQSARDWARLLSTGTIKGKVTE